MRRGGQSSISHIAPSADDFAVLPDGSFQDNLTAFAMANGITVPVSEDGADELVVNYLSYLSRTKSNAETNSAVESCDIRHLFTKKTLAWPPRVASGKPNERLYQLDEEKAEAILHLEVTE